MDWQTVCYRSVVLAFLTAGAVVLAVFHHDQLAGVLAGAGAGFIMPGGTSEVSALAKKAAVGAAACGIVILGLSQLAGCATLKTLAQECAAPGVVAAIDDTANGLLADLAAWQTPTPETWKLRALAMAAKFGSFEMQCAAQHLVGDALRFAGPVTAVACHRVAPDQVPFLKYVAGGGFR